MEHRMTMGGVELLAGRPTRDTVRDSICMHRKVGYEGDSS